jgi:hypothetical protein
MKAFKPGNETESATMICGGCASVEMKKVVRRKEDGELSDTNDEQENYVSSNTCDVL